MGSMYPTDSQYQDEQAMTEGWLYVLGEGSEPSFKLTNNGCYNNQYYDYHLYSWDKVWSGYAALMYKKTGNSRYAEELRFEANNKGGMSEGKYNTCNADWGCTRYNCAVQMEALAAVGNNKDDSLAKGAKYQMNYILGNNPYNKSFLTGYGNSWSAKVHHRAANPGNGNPSDNPTAKYVNYGYLIGGPDASGTFNEVTESYCWTEGALDYNGCFALACAALVNLYGTQGDGAASIVNSASEFKKNYSFGGGSSTPDPKPTYPVATSSVQGNTLTLNWSAVEGAQKYCVAYYSAGKWRILAQGNVLTYTRTKVPAGTYKLVVGAKINGNWDISNINSRAFTVTINK